MLFTHIIIIKAFYHKIGSVMEHNIVVKAYEVIKHIFATTMNLTSTIYMLLVNPSKVTLSKRKACH